MADRADHPRPRVVAEVADEIAVMYAGRIVEQAPTDAIFDAPEHPYTWGLLQSIPRLDLPARRAARADPGPAAEPDQPALGGCAFHPRCPYVRERHKRVDPKLEPTVPSGDRPPRRLPAAHRDARARSGSELHAGATPDAAKQAVRIPRGRRRPGGGALVSETALVEVRDLVKHFPLTRGIIFQRQVGAVHAVDGVSLRRACAGETLGIVGETGCGKTHDGAPDDAPARADQRRRSASTGEDIAHLSRRELKPLRREMQMIFQDPYSSLNPRKTVGAIIGEPFVDPRPRARARATRKRRCRS